MASRKISIDISEASKEDLPEILDLQYLAYQSETLLVGSKDIPPLKQTLVEVENEFERSLFLKATGQRIIGSVRGQRESGIVHVGKLIVHPDFQGRGLGTGLLLELEKCFPNSAFQLFTSAKSLDNLRLYQKLGYKIFKEEALSGNLTLIHLQKKSRS